ncbi:MAG: DUF4270 domain-containing protein, partial [Flavobacteriaceae bacterium]|nr:DUF4270 domain-containing protein [Flavobacteriaceae bacterium]
MKNFKLIFFLSLFIMSCNKDYNTIGSALIDNNPFVTSTEEVPVFVKMRKIPPFVANSLTTFQIGKFEDNIYGNSHASFVTQVNFADSNNIFGILSQDDEDDDQNSSTIDESELVKMVYLDIPFFTNINDNDNDGVIDYYDVDSNDPQSDSDGDGISDSEESNNGQDPLNEDTDGDGILDGEDTDSVNPNSGRIVYEIDSLIGNPDASFKLKISELDYYIRAYDPNTNLEKYQKYYSNSTFSEDYSGKVLFDDQVKINREELIFYKEDDPDTEEDESLIVKERLSPRIRLELDNSFFQTKIVDIEGSDQISNFDNFKRYFKGLAFNAYDFSEPLLMFLNFNEAEIRIVYDYQKINDNGTPDDTTDDSIDTEESEFKLNFNATKFNSFKNDPYPGYVYSSILDTIENPERVYLKGGEGIMAEIELFKDDNGVDLLDEIKSKDWLLNEANLTMYIDQEMLNSSGNIIEPSRLYLYDLVNQVPLVDYFVDNSQGTKPFLNKTTHGGLIELDDDKNGLLYKIRLTEHIKNIVRNDSTNVKLGLVVSSDISNTINIEVQENNLVDFTPFASTINPLGTVLIGPNPSNDKMDKKMKLN